MTTVKIPPVLRPDTEHQREVDVPGTTTAEVLASLVNRFPALDGRVLENGRVQPFLNVYIDGVDIRELRNLDTPVEPDSTLVLLPAMAGG